MRIEISIRVFEDDHKKPNTKLSESFEAFSIKPDMPVNQLLVDCVMRKTNETLVQVICNAMTAIEKEISQIARTERTTSQL